MLKNNSKPKIFLSLLVTGYVLYVLLIFLCFNVYNVSQIKNYLIDLHLYFLEINFFLILIGFILIIPFLKNLFTSIPRRIVYLLIGISVAGILITSFVAPQTHRIYYDENDWNRAKKEVTNWSFPFFWVPKR